jgi:hypothetical protein
MQRGRPPAKEEQTRIRGDAWSKKEKDARSHNRMHMHANGLRMDAYLLHHGHDVLVREVRLEKALALALHARATKGNETSERAS